MFSTLFACFLLGICKSSHETYREPQESFEIVVGGLGMCKLRVVRLIGLLNLLEQESFWHHTIDMMHLQIFDGCS